MDDAIFIKSDHMVWVREDDIRSYDLPRPKIQPIEGLLEIKDFIPMQSR
jgi:hypothetical protein